MGGGADMKKTNKKSACAGCEDCELQRDRDRVVDTIRLRCPRCHHVAGWVLSDGQAPCHRCGFTICSACGTAGFQTQEAFAEHVALIHGGARVRRLWVTRTLPVLRDALSRLTLEDRCGAEQRPEVLAFRTWLREEQGDRAWLPFLLMVLVTAMAATVLVGGLVPPLCPLLSLFRMILLLFTIGVVVILYRDSVLLPELPYAPLPEPLSLLK